MRDVVMFASRSLSYKANCFVLNCCSTVCEEMRRRIPYAQGDRAFFEEAEVVGGTCIVGANSHVLAGPMGAEEGILYADIDLEDVVQAKLVHDYAGHYNRPDIFTLTVKSAVPSLFERMEARLAPAPAVAEIPRATDGGKGPFPEELPNRRTAELPNA